MSSKGKTIIDGVLVATVLTGLPAFGSSPVGRITYSANKVIAITAPAITVTGKRRVFLSTGFSASVEGRGLGKTAPGLRLAS